MSAGLIVQLLTAPTMSRRVAQDQTSANIPLVNRC
jgi:hypothetical protein